MAGFVRWIKDFVRELRRRRVIRVAVVYAGTGFVILELADIVQPALQLPSWTVRFILVLLALGFPLAVGLAWVYNITEEGFMQADAGGDRTEIGPGGKPLTSNWILIGLVIVAIGLLLYPRLFSSGEQRDSEVPAADTAQIDERSIAVLPFEVSGAGAEEWRDGMVTALTLNLDGAAGLRAISDRAVFAAWKKRAKVDEGLSPGLALEVAREVGARYAVVGSAVQLGEDLRFAADIYETSSGGQVDQVEVRGSPDSVTALTDRLTRGVLRILLEKSDERIPSVDLASITTSSLEALKSYLRGERHYRAGEYEAAVQDYRAATQQDSTFALAYARLGRAIAWSGGSGEEEAFRRAYDLSDRLPPRERSMVWAQYARNALDRSLTVADSLRRLTEVYPDDPQVWYLLGETVIHGNIPGGWPEVEEAFLEATRLDPGVVPYHIHLVDAAMTFHRDSALVARRIESHPEGRIKEIYKAYQDLIFGTPQHREAAFARLDTLRLPETENRWWAWWPLRHPMDRALQARVLETFRNRDDTNPERYGYGGVTNLLARGQVAEGLSVVREAGALSCIRAAIFMSEGYPIPDSILRRGPQPSTLGADASPPQLLCAGFRAVREGRGDELPQILSWLRQGARESGDQEAMAQTKVIANELKGYGAWTAGDREEAARLWSRWKPGMFGTVWRGDLYQELGEFETAEEWYLADWEHPVAHERLGQLYEKMGKPEKAAAAYRRFIEAWKHADPALQDRVEKARQRLVRLKETAQVDSPTDRPNAQ